MAKPIKGLLSDVRPLDQPDGTYPHGKNGLQYDVKGAVTNEQGFDKAIVVTVPGEVIGIIESDGPAIVYSIRTIDGEEASCIGLYDRKTASYTEKLNDRDFQYKWKFSRDHYITGEAQRNYLNELLVVWTDKVEAPRMLNLDRISEITDIKQTLLFLQSQTPSIDVDIIDGGILDKGAYFVAAKYLKTDGSETGYLTISAPRIASNSDNSTITNQALQIVLSNLDRTFDKVQLAIISRIGGKYEARALDPQEIPAGDLTINYTGENLYTSITLDEILVPNAVYSRVGTMGQLNDALYIADLEKEPELNLQKWANLVKLRVKSELIDVIPAPADHVKGKTKSLMHQETYAVYIRYHKTTGSWTRAFHCPGIKPLSGDLAFGSTAQEMAIDAKVYQTNDTNRSLDATSKTVDTGVWINQTEVYPGTDDFDSSAIGGEDLRGLPVRHHKMPSIAFCKDNFYASESNYGRTKLDILSLEVTNVVIPTDLQGLIDGYEILIAKRTIANTTVIGQSLFMVDAISNQKFASNQGFVSTGGNWHSNGTGRSGYNTKYDPTAPTTLILTGKNRDPAVLGNWANLAERKGLRWRTHSFDMLFNKPAVNPSYLSPQLKMRVNNLDTAGYLEDGELNNQRMPVMMIVDYANSFGTAQSPTSVGASKRIRKIKNQKYLPHNIDTGEHNNANLEAAYVGEIDWVNDDPTQNDFTVSADLGTVNFANFQHTAARVRWEETYLTNIMDIKGDLYSVFYAQPLIASGTFVPITNPRALIYCGDTFLNEYTYHTYGWFDGDNHPGNDNPEPTRLGGYKIIRRFICEAVSNINLRYEDAANEYSKWWPHNPMTSQPSDTDGYLYHFDRNEDPNKFGYNKDLNTANDFGNYQPYSPFYVDVTKFPFRVHRGGKLPRQGKVRSWRSFLPLDYYEAQKNMGRIIRVLGKSDKLIIHHENAIFHTQDKAKLDAGDLSVTLGTGDIFQFEPQEVIPSRQGYAGTQHELAAVDTPIGYIFADAKQGQVFILKDGVKLVNQGLTNFFKEYLRITATNSFVGNGITIGYDPEKQRILLSVKNRTLSSPADFSNFVPNYEPTEAFIATLTEDVSIVYKDGTYQLFKGFNSTEYSCEAVPPLTCSEDGLELSLYEFPVTQPGAYITDISSLFSSPVTITQYLLSGNVGNAFYLNPTSGQLFVNNASAIDYELRHNFALTVKAINAAGVECTATVVIDVINVNEAPIVGDYEWFIPETAPNGLSVGQVIGSDPEGTPLTYSLITTGTPFSVNSSTGVITVTNHTLIDYDTQDAWAIQVGVSDGVTTVISHVLIHITNVNEAPVGENATVIIYKDLAHSNDLVSTMVYEDPDNTTDTVTWLDASTYATRFAFDPATLQVTLLNPATINAGEVYVLHFQVTDGDGLSDTFTLTIQVLNSAIHFVADSYICLTATCGAGYTLSPDGTYCFKYDDVAATPPVSGTPLMTEARQFSSYSDYGSIVYNPGYNVNGAGPYVYLNTANGFWKNLPVDTISGPLNRTALWAVDTDGDGNDDPLNTSIGFSIPVNVPTSSRYLIGIAGDNKCQIKVDGVTVVNQDPTAIKNNVNTQEGVTWHDAQDAFKFWHIYPVDLTAGQHYIELTGINVSSVGGFGAEIYNATAAELEAATSYADLGDKLIFSTKDVRGQTLQIGGTFAYSCPAGYSLVESAPGVYFCRKILTTSSTGNHTKRWTTVNVLNASDALLITLGNTPGQTYMGQAVPYYPDEADSTDCGGGL